MKIFMKIVITSFLILTISGCGNSTKISKNVTNDKNQQEQQQNEQEQIENNQELVEHESESNTSIKQEDNKEEDTEEEQSYYEEDESNEYESDNGEDIVIIDSTLSYAPNIDLYDSDPSGAYYDYEYDSQKGYVVSLHSNWIKNSFHILGYDVNKRYKWNEMPSYQNRLHISWDGKFSDDFIVFIVLKFKTAGGEKIWRDLVYTPTPNGYDRYTNDFLHISLGSSAKDGNWHHFERDVLSDLRRFYPGATIDYNDGQSGYINGFAVRGSGEITNIRLSY